MKFGLLLFTLLTNVCFGAITVSHLAENDVQYFRAGDTSSNFNTMVFEPSSGGGTAESSPHKTYVPLSDLSGSVDQPNNNILSDSSSIPSLSAGDVFSFYFRILVDADVTAAEDEIVQVAFYDGSNYYNLDALTNSLSASQYNTTESYWELIVNIEEACNTTNKPQECTDLRNSSDGTKTETLKFYVFGSTTDFADGDVVTPSSVTGGIFYEVSVSDAIPSGTVTLDSITKGDGRLTLNVSGGNSVTNMSSSIVYRSVVFTNAAGSSSAQAEGVSDIIQSDTAVKEGQIEVKNLNNNTAYTLATSLVNKYQFATTSTNALTETPLEIEALLKSQACYLVTAGFQKEHYVLDYFRSIRDNYLLKFAPSKKLVDFYYATAPAYAPVIYNSPKLSLIVRSLSYGVYFFLKFFWYILGLGLIVLALRLRNFRINLAS